MEELIELLEEIQPDADFENCDTLIDDGILDSFAILSIVSELQDTYDITITPADIIPENFNSAKALWDMVSRLKGRFIYTKQTGIIIVLIKSVKRGTQSPIIPIGSVSDLKKS